VRGETMICGRNDLLFAFAVSINMLQDELKVGLKNAMKKNRDSQCPNRQSMSKKAGSKECGESELVRNSVRLPCMSYRS
jgi:hypothetical protein